MDSLLDEFCRKVLDWRHQSVSTHELHRLASHLRDIVQPQLARLEAIEVKATDGKAPKKAATA